MSKSNPNYIWLSNARLDSRNSRRWFPFGYKEGGRLTDEQKKVFRKSKTGQVVSKDEFPSDLYAPSSMNDHKKAKRHFVSCGVMIISEESANVLQDFDLGEGGLYPVRLWFPDQKTRLKGNYFHLNVAAKKMHSFPKKPSKKPGPTERIAKFRVAIQFMRMISTFSPMLLLKVPTCGWTNE